jgi:hypothetical protein
VFLNSAGFHVIFSEMQQSLGPFSLPRYNLDSSCFTWCDYFFTIVITKPPQLMVLALIKGKIGQNFHFYTLCYRKLEKIGTGRSDGF